MDIKNRAEMKGKEKMKTLVETNHILIELNTDEIGFELAYYRDMRGFRIRFLIFVIGIA